MNNNAIQYRVCLQNVGIIRKSQQTIAQIGVVHIQNLAVAFSHLLLNVVFVKIYRHVDPGALVFDTGRERQGTAGGLARDGSRTQQGLPRHDKPNVRLGFRTLTIAPRELWIAARFAGKCLVQGLQIFVELSTGYSLANNVKTDGDYFWCIGLIGWFSGSQLFLLLSFHETENLILSGSVLIIHIVSTTAEVTFSRLRVSAVSMMMCMCMMMLVMMFVMVVVIFMLCVIMLHSQ